MSEITLVEVEETGEGRLMQSIRNGQHQLRADEPEDLGGDDTGPAPYGFLLSALGACTSMTVRLYADSKKWPLQHIHVRLVHEKRRATERDDNPPASGWIDEIRREIELQGALTDEQRARLLEIANRCPVHRSLTENQIRVGSALASTEVSGYP